MLRRPFESYYMNYGIFSRSRRIITSVSYRWKKANDLFVHENVIANILGHLEKSMYELKN